MRVDIRSQLVPIARRIRQAEQKLMPPEYRESVKGFGETYFPLGGTGEPWYGPTPLLALIEHLEWVKAELKLPSSLHAADLGSGLGNGCIAEAAVFDHVTGFENCPRVFNEAVGIRDEFRLTSIEYRLEDFMLASWKEFNLLYFFKPRAEENLFQQLMEKFLATAPGTVIISRRFMDQRLYAPGDFTYLPPLADPHQFTAPYFPLAEFYTFVKK